MNLLLICPLLLTITFSAGSESSGYCTNGENRSRIFNCNTNFSQSLTISGGHLFNNKSQQNTFELFSNLSSNDHHSKIQSDEGIHLDHMISMLPPYSPVHAKGVQCRAHSELFMRELREMKLWALQMYDSSAKAGSGLLNGNIVLLGDYDQCLAVDRGEDNEQGRITGQYCVATIYIKPLIKPNKNWHLAGTKHQVLHHIIDLMQSHNAMTNDYEDDMRFLPTFSPISYALCIPSSCSNDDLQHSLTESLSPFNLTSGVDLKVVVDQRSCMTKHSNPLDLPALLTALLLGSIILFAVIGTYYEKNNLNAEGQLEPLATKGLLGKLLISLSFRKNWYALIDTSVPEDELTCVHGIRFIASFFIYVIHRSVFTMFYPFTNRTEVAQLLEGDWTMLFRAFWNWVDSFVILSGLLTSFYAFKRLKSGRKLNIPQMYLQRYIKFTPMLFMCALVTQNLLQHMVRGPQLIRVVDHYVQNCKRGLLPVVTYTNVLEGFEKMCYPPSHQLATDMHMYLLAPFIILGVWKWPRAGSLSVVTSLVVLGIMKYFVMINEELGSFLYYGVSIKQLIKSANHIYINAVHRLTPYIFGMGLGYILNKTTGTLTKVQMGTASVIAFVSALYSFYGVAHVARKDYIFEVKEAATFGVVQPVLWSFALCWFIYCCATNQAPGWLLSFLKWRGFIIYSRLSYAIYLVQIYIIAVGVGNVMTSEYFTIAKMVDLNEISAVALTALLFTLLFLLPLSDLWAIATGNYTPPVYTKSKITPEEHIMEQSKLKQCQE